MLIIVCVRQYLVGSYRIIGERKGESLQAGDCVLVNKLKKSGVNPGRNRLILYTSPLRRDARRPPVLLGRCAGMPGDSIEYGADGFRINGILLPDLPLTKPMFRIRKDVKPAILSTMEVLNIPLRDVREDSVSLFVRLSMREKELLMNTLSKTLSIELLENSESDYRFTVPGKNKTLPITPLTMTIYGEAIQSELGMSAVISENRLYINGSEVGSYVFSNDYYWVLSENETGGVDSRHLGLIPSEHIIGNVWYCWYSSDRARRYKKVD